MGNLLFTIVIGPSQGRRHIGNVIFSCIKVIKINFAFFNHEIILCKCSCHNSSTKKRQCPTPPEPSARGCCPRTQGGRTRLPKFKFSAKFPIGLHVILPIQIKKIRKWLLYYVKKYFNRKSVEVQRWTPLEIMLNGVCLKIIR